MKTSTLRLPKTCWKKVFLFLPIFFRNPVVPWAASKPNGQQIEKKVIEQNLSLAMNEWKKERERRQIRSIVPLHKSHLDVDVWWRERREETDKRTNKKIESVRRTFELEEDFGNVKQTTEIRIKNEMWNKII